MAPQHMLTELRWWNTVRYHHPSQLAWRGVSVIRRRLFPVLPHAYYSDADGTTLVCRENAGFDAIVSRHRKLRSKAHVDRASAIDGEFVFLNECRKLSVPIDWRLKNVEPVSHLWRFHLHYHEFLLDWLADSCEADGKHREESLWNVIEDWITANPVTRVGALSDAWHPFCLSKRIAVWLMLWRAIEPPPEVHNRFASSLEGQIRYLERHLEWDLRGNHLLENLRTLAMAGAFFEGETAERRLDRAVRLLQTQFSEQILPSGEHFERSPMYHAQMLSAVLDIRDAVTACRPEFAERCVNVAERMAGFLRTILHPDGQVALFGDTAFGETPCVATLLSAVEGRTDVADSEPGRHVLDQAKSVASAVTGTSGRDAQTYDPHASSHGSAQAMVVAASDRARQTPSRPQCVASGGYWKWQSGEDCLLFDAAPVGADELPAHAHCDLLTFEASIDGRRVVVDSGVYDYSGSEMRRYCRSTAAHNVLQIDGVEQCDVWSRFRMGYRGHPSPLEFGETGDFSWCGATHNAYRRIEVPVVGRWLACREGGPWFCVDWAEGHGRHEMVGRLHLAPDVTVTQMSPTSVQINVAERCLEVRSLSNAEITVEKGWYCPDFGIRHEVAVLAYASTAALPAPLGWMVHDANDCHDAQLQEASHGEIELNWRHGQLATTFRPIRSVRGSRD